MQNSDKNFGNNLSKTSILNELPLGNAELGEAFALSINDMVVQSGITNPKSEPFDITTPSWRALAQKENKTEEELQKLDTTFKDSVNTLAQSYILYIARNTGNISGKLSYEDYEKFMLKYRFGHFNIENRMGYITKVKEQIKNAFDKIASHGETAIDDIIDKNDMASYIFALSTKSKRDAQNNFLGFEINGIITAQDYAVFESELFESEDNLASLKLRVAYNQLNNIT